MTRAVLLATMLSAACSNGGRDGATELEEHGGGESVGITDQCALDDAAKEIRLSADLVYGSVDGQTLRLDLARPTDGGPHPLVVMFHGGAWAAGSRLDMRGEILALARRGYAAASVQYRLTRAPRNIFPAAVEDVRCAVRWLRSRADDYHLDPTRIAAAGFSAGGHLAALLGTAPEVAGMDRSCATGNGDGAGDLDDLSPVVRAVLSYAAPHDLRVNGPYTAEQAQLVTNFLGAFPGDAPERAALASPIVHVDRGDPPFLLVHGTRDDLVPVEQSWRMATALKTVGTPATVLEVEGLGHSYVGFASRSRPRVTCTGVAFLDRWLRQTSR